VEKILDSSHILPWGLRIEVAECDEKDLFFVKGVSLNRTIVKIADAIKAADYISGEWLVREDGKLLRPEGFCLPGKGMEVLKSTLSPITPNSNLVALLVFWEILKKEAPWVEIGFPVTVESPFLRMGMYKDGLYINEVRSAFEYKTIMS
jgi:hypothetical protein